MINGFSGIDKVLLIGLGFENPFFTENEIGDHTRENSREIGDQVVDLKAVGEQQQNAVVYQRSEGGRNIIFPQAVEVRRVK